MDLTILVPSTGPGTWWAVTGVLADQLDGWKKWCLQSVRKVAREFLSVLFFAINLACTAGLGTQYTVNIC